MQNPVIGSLIWEVDIDRKKDQNKFLDKAPAIRDLELRSRLKKLCNEREFFKRGDKNNNNNNNNGGLQPPPSPPHFNFLDELAGQQRTLPNV